MRILALIDPPQTLDPLGDTTVVILDEARRRGHEIYIAELHQLWLRDGQPGADVRLVSEIRRDGPPAIRCDTTTQSRSLEEFHVVFIRKDPPYDPTYHLATLILEYARGKTLLVNDPRGLREANEKLYIFHFPDLLAPTLVTNRIDELRAFLAAQGGQIVVKPLDGHGGSSVFQLRSDDPNTSTILEIMSDNGKRWVMAQRYLDIARAGDKRILLLNGEPIGAVLRMPQPRELRSNLHVGGQAVRTELSAREHEICARIKPRLLQDGLVFVGIDVIDGHLTEVNVTSPTGIQSINRLQQIRLESKVVDFFEQHAPRSS